MCEEMDLSCRKTANTSTDRDCLFICRYNLHAGSIWIVDVKPSCVVLDLRVRFQSLYRRDCAFRREAFHTECDVVDLTTRSRVRLSVR